MIVLSFLFKIGGIHFLSLEGVFLKEKVNEKILRESFSSTTPGQNIFFMSHKKNFPVRML